jgi:beta-glucosidase-like glycosyl hydrolase
MKKLLLALVVNGFLFSASAQYHTSLNAEQWVDSVFKTLSKDQKIAQLMVVRLSTIDQSTKTVTFFDKQVEEAIRKYNIGGICLFQGGPLRQVNIINSFQSFAKTPLLICIDGENGVGMRVDSVKGLPRQMMLGAVQDPDIIYQFGKIVGEQCKRMGIQVNYAPVVDINNNPANPVINDRSFGEDKYKVANYGIQYMKGMQDVGVMGCAKHFPGHGDVSVDSHKDLPVINKTKEQLDSLELYPFREIFKAGVGSVMVAHLYIPSIDSTPNRATSISYKNVTGLLRNELGYKGLTFTDALEMKGVSKFFPDGEASVQSLIAGNDMLCLPGDIPGAIKKTKTAIKKKKLSWSDIDEHVKRVLLAKYQYGLANLQPVNTDNLAKDLNKDVDAMWHKVSENAITVLRNDDASIFPLAANTTKKVAYVGIGLNADNVFAKRMRSDYSAHVYYFNSRFTNKKADDLLDLLKDSYDVVIVGVHNYSRFPGNNNFGINGPAVYFMQQLQQQQKSINLFFGNPYAAKIACDAKILLTCYEDDDVTQAVAADLLNGKFFAKGKLPVTICDAYKYGSGVLAQRTLPEVEPVVMRMNEKKLQEIDSIAADAIQKKAIPGCVILVAKDGKIVYDKAFGYLTYENVEPTYTETIYDLASVTKIMATTLSVMKLYDEGKIDLKKKLKDYLPWTSGSNKENLVIGDILLHQAGLKSYIPMYKETVDSTRGGIPSGAIYGSKLTIIIRYG